MLIRTLNYIKATNTKYLTMDDVLNPRVVQIGGRNYCDYFSDGKLNETHEDVQEFDPDNGFGGDWLMEDDEDGFEEDCENSCDFDVFQPNNGGFVYIQF